MLAVTDHDLHVLGRGLARTLRQLLVDLDCGYRANVRRQCKRKGTGAGADIERALLARQGEQLLDLSGETRGA
jgi:hypothetical protein